MIIAQEWVKLPQSKRKISEEADEWTSIFME